MPLAASPPSVSNTLSFIRTGELGELGKESQQPLFSSDVGHQRKHKVVEPCPLTAFPSHRSAHLLIQPVCHPPQCQHPQFYPLQLTLQQNPRQWLLSPSLALVVGEAPSLLLPDSCLSSSETHGFKIHVLRLLNPPPASPVSCQLQQVSLFPTMAEPSPLLLIPTSLLPRLLVMFIHCR